jgi:hypothetical protein
VHIKRHPLKLYGDWRYSSILNFGTRFEVSGQLHASSALPVRKEPWFPVEAVWAPQPVSILWRRRKLYPFLKSNPDSSVVHTVA